MKKILILALTAITFASCQQNSSGGNSSADSTGSSLATDNTLSVSNAASMPGSPDAAVVKFETSSHDFGEIKEGEKVHYDFKFINTGKTPLIISNATATCGCTIPEVPKEPISPGKEAVIKVVFDSTGKMGRQDKVITVSSNGNPAVNEVHLVGTVTPR